MRAAAPGPSSTKSKRRSKPSTCAAAPCAGDIPRSSAAARTPRFSTTASRRGRCRGANCCWWTRPRSYEGMTGDITRTYPVERKVHARTRVTSTRSSCGRRRTAMKAAQGRRTAFRVTTRRRGPSSRAAQARADHRRRPATNSESGLPMASPLDRHRRPRRRRTADRSRAGHGIRDRAGHLHPSQALEDLPPPRRICIHRAVKPVVEKYKNIGIRIEDSFLLTVRFAAPHRLRPRTIEEIEGWMKRGTM